MLKHLVPVVVLCVACGGSKTKNDDMAIPPDLAEPDSAPAPDLTDRGVTGLTATSTIDGVDFTWDAYPGATSYRLEVKFPWDDNFVSWTASDPVEPHDTLSGLHALGCTPFVARVKANLTGSTKTSDELTTMWKQRELDCWDQARPTDGGFRVSATRGNNLFVAGSRKFMRSTDGGATFTDLAPRYPSVVSIAVTSSRVFVETRQELGFGGTSYHVSTDNGATFSELSGDIITSSRFKAPGMYIGQFAASGEVVLTLSDPNTAPGHTPAPKLLRSSDGGATFDVVPSAPALTSLVSGGEHGFVARTSDGLAVSADGMTWRTQAFTNVSDLYTLFVVHTPTMFAIYAYDSGSTKRLITTTDGQVWTNDVITIDGKNGVAPSSYAYGHGMFVAGGYGYMLYSADGKAWTRVTVPALVTVSTVVSTSAGFMGFGGAGLRLVGSSDGKTWTIANLGPTVRAVAQGPGNLAVVAGGESGLILSKAATDANWSSFKVPTFETVNTALGSFAVTPTRVYKMAGTNQWTEVLYDAAADFRAIAHCGMNWSVVGQSNRLAYSTNDGQTWSSATGTNAGSVACKDGLFVAVNGNQILTSTDGAAYAAVTNTPTFSGGVIAYGNGTFVIAAHVIAAPAIALKSADGQTWTSSAPVEELEGAGSITFGSGRFFASGPDLGASATSTDGTTWVRLAPATRLYSTGMGFANGLFYVAADDGELLSKQLP